MDIFRGTVAAQLDYSYTSTFYSDIRNYDASLLPGYGLADARLEWRSNKGHWSVAAFVNNFTDRRYYTIGYDLAAVTGSDSLVPRQAALVRIVGPLQHRPITESWDQTPPCSCTTFGTPLRGPPKSAARPLRE